MQDLETEVARTASDVEKWRGVLTRIQRQFEIANLAKTDIRCWVHERLAEMQREPTFDPAQRRPVQTHFLGHDNSLGHSGVSALESQTQKNSV